MPTAIRSAQRPTAYPHRRQHSKLAHQQIRRRRPATSKTNIITYDMMRHRPKATAFNTLELVAVTTAPTKRPAEMFLPIRNRNKKRRGPNRRPPISKRRVGAKF